MINKLNTSEVSKNVFFSVIIPAYNCAHLIGETLESVFAQHFTDYEIIIVNDGSTDTTAGVISSYVSLSDKNITVINQENKGEGGARNSGIFAARGRYLAFLDSDDLWYPWTLESYFKVLQTQEYPLILIATGTEFRCREDIAKIVSQVINVSVYEDFFSAAHHRYLPVGTPGTVVNTKEAQRVGGLGKDRVNGLDQEFFLKLGLTKGLVHLVSPVTVAIRRHDGNLQHNVIMTAKGVLLFINKENRGLYPGGNELMPTRQNIIGRSARTISLQCLKYGHFVGAWSIYSKTFFWHLKQLKFKYLCGFPVLSFYESINQKWKAISGTYFIPSDQ